MVLPDVLGFVAGAAVTGPWWAWCEGCRVVRKFAIWPPVPCAKCGSTWIRVELWSEPKPPKPYKLSENDRRLLHGLKIGVE